MEYQVRSGGGGGGMGGACLLLPPYIVGMCRVEPGDTDLEDAG